MGEVVLAELWFWGSKRSRSAVNSSPHFLPWGPVTLGKLINYIHCLIFSILINKMGIVISLSHTVVHSTNIVGALTLFSVFFLGSEVMTESKTK